MKWWLYCIFNRIIRRHWHSGDIDTHLNIPDGAMLISDNSKKVEEVIAKILCNWEKLEGNKKWEKLTDAEKVPFRVIAKKVMEAVVNCLVH